MMTDAQASMTIENGALFPSEVALKSSLCTHPARGGYEFFMQTSCKALFSAICRSRKCQQSSQDNCPFVLRAVGGEDGSFEVVSTEQFSMNLYDKMCSCKRWQEY